MKFAQSTYYYRSRRASAIRNATEENYRALCGISALWLPAHHGPAANRGPEGKS